MPQVMDTNTQKVIQTVKLHISHQLKPYSNVKTIWGLICMFKFAFQNGVNELFWSSGSGDIARQLLKKQFGKLNNYRFCPTFWNFIGGNFLKKCPIFWTLNAHILKTVNARELNESILNSSHEGLSLDAIVRFYIWIWKSGLTCLL